MRSIEDIIKMKIVYPVDNTDCIKEIKDITYKKLDSKTLSMDLYRPFQQAKGKLPVVILIHGEAPSINFKETGQYTSYGKLVASLGLNAITFNHRVLSDGAIVEEVISDIEDLMDYLIINADNLQLDMNKVIFWSFSAGVPFSLYVGMQNYADRIQGLIAYYGFGDFLSLQKCFGQDIPQETMIHYSPIKLLDRKENTIPPLLIVRAGLDNPIINESIDDFILAALKNNLHIECYNHPNGGHSFDLFTNDDRSKNIIKRSLDFLTTYLL